MRRTSEHNRQLRGIVLAARQKIKKIYKDKNIHAENKI